MFSISSKNHHHRFQNKDDVSEIPSIKDTDIYIFYFWPISNLKTTDVFENKRRHKETFIWTRHLKEHSNIQELCSKFLSVLNKTFSSIDDILKHVN